MFIQNAFFFLFQKKNITLLSYITYSFTKIFNKTCKLYLSQTSIGVSREKTQSQVLFKISISKMKINEAYAPFAP